MNRTVRFVLPLLAVLGLASAQLYQDVPDGHWARNAVDEATRLGLVTGFPDGTFRGEELLNRYQAAMILYRLVQYLESRPAAAVDPATIAAMQTLLARLESELRATQTRLAELDAATLRTQDLAAAQNDLARLRALVDAAAGLSPGDLKRLSDALPEMKEVLANYVALRNDVEDLRARLLGAEARASELEVRVLEAARAVADLQSALSRLAGQNRDLAERVARLESTLFQRLDERYLTVERFQGVVEPLSQRLREAETRLDRVEEQLNGTQRLLDPNAPRLESLRLRAGARAASGPALPADLDRPGGYDGDQDVTSFDYEGPATRAHFGLSARYRVREAALDYGFLAEVDPVAPTGFNPLRWSGSVRYQDEGRALSLDLRPAFRFQLTPYLLDHDAAGFDYGARFQLRQASFGLEAGYFLDGPNRYSYAALDLKPAGAELGLGFALDPQSTAILFLRGQARYSGVGLRGVCHYPTALPDALICYGQLRLDTDFARVTADYRWLAPGATSSSYFALADNDEPYRADQTGFGVRARLSLARFLLEGTWQSYTLSGDPHRYLHVGGSLPLSRSFTVSAFYDAATLNYAPVPVLPAETPGQTYRNLWGAALAYSGPADVPALAGLRLRAGYEIDRALPEAYPYLAASYDLPSPSLQLGLAARARGGVNWDHKAAAALATRPIDLPLGPSLEARAAYADGRTFGQETLFGLGLRLTRLPFEGLQLGFRGGFYASDRPGAGGGYAAFDRVLDPTLPGLYGGQPPASGQLFYYGAEATFEGFRFSAGRYVGLPSDVYLLRFDYDRRF